MTPSVRAVVLAGFVGALGLGFPWAFHLVGAGHLGRMFLPMFLPLVAGAFFLPAALAMFTGGVTPLLSALLTGMPPLAPPIAFLMMGELMAMTGTVALAYRWLQWNVWISLAIAVAVDRVILALLAAGLSGAFGLPAWMVTWGSLVIGLPGIVLLFLVIPPLVKRLNPSAERRHV